MFIEINDLTKSIHGTVVLESISLRLEGGHIYGLKGPNGCGKTMLMRCVCGLIRPTRGMVSIDGEILGKTISFPRSIGALIENPAFIDGYTGFKNLQMLADIQRKVSRQQLRDTLSAVGLVPDDRRKFRKYSLGMKQRLGIAAAIAEIPDIIILDEPINALDEDGVKLIKNILYNERKRGALILLACHDKEELEFLSDEVIEMKDGRVVNQYRMEKADETA
ncbi:MAG: ATP-binding cassette domain-containing protein [Oscillospiraceae bacterium]|nr:ATP-binding cassette domain-containing protein [Oscillospiraceae bacterium]MDD4414477.1 ATP-binding cassette domain-containing protein [Oscillospiraceae bacterium]